MIKWSPAKESTIEHMFGARRGLHWGKDQAMIEKGAGLEVDDLIVLLLGAPSKKQRGQDRIEGITRLEKLVFLLDNETDLGALLSEDPDFEAYNFGPFSKKVYDAVDTLAAAGLLEDSAVSSSTADEAWESQQVIGAELPDGYSTRSFSLTDRGRRYYEALASDLPQGTKEQLTRFKDIFASIPLRQLVRYVYERHPEYTVNSVIRDEILGS